jgi:hypothetical protein
MLRLNTSPDVLQKMGAPLVGSQVRATVCTGGHFSFGRRLLPVWQSKRCSMIFPLTGSLRRGLVSVEAKKWKGDIVYKLLAVDVSGAGASPADREEQRLYLKGDSTVFHRGGVIAELRDPFLHALEMEEGQYLKEDLEDEQREEREEEAERERGRPKSLEQGGGMFLYERVYYGARDALHRLQARAQGVSGGAAAAPRQP